MSGYNNVGFSPEAGRYDRVPDNFNNRMEIPTYHAYNETFVDDNGVGAVEEYVDFPREVYVRTCKPKCRRSIAVSPPARTEPISVEFHRDGPCRLRYESVSSEGKSCSPPRKPPPRLPRTHQYESIEALQRRYEEIEAANEEYVDYPEDRMGSLDYLKAEGYMPVRESPIGSSGTIRYVEASRPTPSTTPQKKHPRTPTRHLSRRNTVVLAPILAQMERDHIRRSSSSVWTTPTKTRHHVEPPSPTKSIARSTHSLYVPPRLMTPVKLKSFSHIVEEMEEVTVRTPNRRPNTAVITPNMRGSTVPLLTSSANSTPKKKDLPSPPPAKSPSNFSIASWATIPNVQFPTEMLCCTGFIMLACGAASTILCFYILSQSGRRYFLDFGAVAGFTALLLGVLSFRTNRWKWLPHRNYLTGFLLLGMFSIVNTGCLGGICYALLNRNYALLDTLGGAVCGMSTLIICGSLVGMVTSGCCHRPPPDSRVAHCVTGFTV